MMCSPGINGEGELRGQLANPGSPGKWLLNGVCVCVWTIWCRDIAKTTIFKMEPDWHLDMQNFEFSSRDLS